MFDWIAPQKLCSNGPILWHKGLMQSGFLREYNRLWAYQLLRPRFAAASCRVHPCPAAIGVCHQRLLLTTQWYPPQGKKPIGVASKFVDSASSTSLLLQRAIIQAAFSSRRCSCSCCCLSLWSPFRKLGQLCLVCYQSLLQLILLCSGFKCAGQPRAPCGAICPQHTPRLLPCYRPCLCLFRVLQGHPR